MYVRETKIERYLCDQVAALPNPSICEKHVSPGRRGCPDRLVSYNGHMYLVELKAPKGKLAVAQRRDHELRRRCGIAVFCLYALEQVDNFVWSLSLL